MPHLFEPFRLRDVTFANRVFVSPMCQYSSDDGLANEWHLVHLGSRAVGGAALVLTEATAVTPDGRISPRDIGLWSDRHAERLAPIVAFVRSQGGHAGIQLAHAGRKASTVPPWDGHHALTPDDGGWVPVAPSAIAFSPALAEPRALTVEQIGEVVTAFADAARRALAIGCSVVEVHAAHGYLLHEFLSPLSNQRTDDYGGSFANRTRLLRAVVSAVRAEWPERLPLFVRISATDWVEGGWDLEQSIALARELRALGVDLLDCSSGGTSPSASMSVGPGYQVPFASEIRRATGMPTGAVGMITSPEQADHVVRTGQADAVLLARELLRDPYWPLHAARHLGHAASWPVQYLRSAPAGSGRRAPLVD